MVTDEMVEKAYKVINESWWSEKWGADVPKGLARRAIEAALSAAEPVAKQYRAESSEGGTGWRPENDEMHMWWKDFEKRHPGSVTFYYRDLYTYHPVAVKDQQNTKAQGIEI